MTDVKAFLSPRTGNRIPFWRDVRVLGVVGQLAFIVFVIFFFRTIGSNFIGNIEKLGKAQFICNDGSYSLRCMFDFMQTQAGFEIAETPLSYEVTDSYWYALSMGILNTLKVAVLAILGSTVLGTLTGIARLSNNWLVRSIAKWYIELIRNTPLLVQIVVIYFVVFLTLPQSSKAIQAFNLPIFLSQRSLSFPRLVPTASFSLLLAFLILGIIEFQVLWIALGKRQTETGRNNHRMLWGLAGLILIAGLGWLVSPRILDSEGILIPKSSRMRSVDQAEQVVLDRAGVDHLPDLQRLTPEQRADAALKICTLQSGTSEANVASVLRSQDIPFRVVKRAENASLAAEGLLTEECDAVAASKSVLTAQLTAMETPASYLILNVPQKPLVWSVPRREGLNIAGGVKVSPEFAGLLTALVIYAGAFIAEIVRAGILSVSKGQKDAAIALGLTEGQRLRLIVLPQALRVIIPPIISEYLGTIKDSSLGIAIGFPEMYNVSYTIINQSGRSIQVITIIMVVYLMISLATSALLNWYNTRIQFVER